MRVAIQGLPGSFHHIVAQKYFGAGITLLHKNTFREVFDAVASDAADYGVVATENTLYGSISDAMDLAEEYRLPIVGEHIEKIHHYFVGAENADPSAITHIYSQIMALRQCDNWLREHYPRAELIEYFDTSGAVEMVVKKHDPSSAAIGSKLAAELHGAKVLAKDIQDELSNMTKFIILQKDGRAQADANFASLILTTTHQPGALYQALGVFSRENINLTSLVSRPKRGEPWLYRFHISVEAAGAPLHRAIDELQMLDFKVILLGEYRNVASEKEDQ